MFVVLKPNVSDLKAFSVFRFSKSSDDLGRDPENPKSFSAKPNIRKRRRKMLNMVMTVDVLVKLTFYGMI